ncbi:MAG: helix-turn-helix transcriptional regulator [Eubacterium sp.]|nr:helix-turn-helix transcriptional regulator [Eubacterium sp.]
MDKEIIKYSYIHGVTIADGDTPTVFPSHWHNSAEFILTNKKGCVIKIGEETYYPEAGDIVFVWPRELHEIKKSPEKGYTLLQFSPSLIENNTDIATAARFLKKCHHISKKEETELSKAISSYMNELMDIYYNKQYFVETRCKILIYNILLLIGENVMQEHKELIGNEKFSDKSWEYIRSACGYISEHSSEELSQTEVADAVGLSPYYFSKLFKDYTQMTFPAYLANIRVQNAINLLEDKKLSITECAFSAGFQSTTTFNKIFREATGCTPREYRNLHDNEKLSHSLHSK